MTLEKQELDRIETAKTAIGTAIAGKGVAVPSGTKLDGMAALIDGIEAGGEDVSAETAEYTSLLTDLETAIDALPDAESGGGGSVEPCTVTVTNRNASVWSIAYVSESGAMYDATGISPVTTKEFTVIKNSVLAIACTNFLPNIVCDGSIAYLGDGATATHIKMLVFSIGGSGTITIRDDD